MIADIPMKGPLMSRNLQEAFDMTKKCEEICQDFEKHQQPAMVHEWKAMKRRWELDPSQPDPYRVTEKGETTTNPNHSRLIPVFCSLEPRLGKTKACGD